MRPHIFTSITTNYLPKARVLARSVKRFHPDFRFHLVLSDAAPAGFRLDDEPFDSLIEVSGLGIPNPDQWLFQHSRTEASTGVKGFALVKILELPDCSEVLYLDPDIVVLAPLDGLLQEFDTASVLLTPHLCEPEETAEAILDNELCTLQHGIYNLGFVGVKKSAGGLRFAQWWKDRLYRYCYDDIPNGLFTDQRWADFVPVYFPDHRILRDPVYNVCTWNLTHRLVSGDLETGLRVNGHPVVFYHFSGLDSGAQLAMLDKYGASMKALYELRAWYLAECDRMGQGTLGGWPWLYATFENGEKIHALHRTRYRNRPDLQKAFENPFLTSDVSRSYYHWFEANDESRVRPVPGAAATAHARPSLPPVASYPNDCYRIFLSVSGGDAALAAASAKQLFAAAHARSQLHLIGPGNMVDALLNDREIADRFGAVRLPAGATHAEAFAEVLRRFHDRDFLFVAGGVHLPPLGDLRLSWAAYRQHDLATVSPVSFGGDAAPFRIGPFPGHPAPPVEAIDRYCYECSLFETADLNSFRQDCVYVRGEAARIAHAAATSGQDAVGGFREAALRARLSQVLVDHVCTGTASEAARAAPPGAFEDFPAAAMALVAGQSRRVLRHFTTNSQRLEHIASAAKPRQLHLMHSWGGGLECWVQEYCRGDRAHENYVLKSVGTWGAFGKTLSLYRHVDDPEPMRTWRLDAPIPSTAIAHEGYRAAFFEIIASLGIELVMVSSLIGHSLDVLGSGLPTFLVCHDFYPFCPALYISFEGVCHSCSAERLTRCTAENPHNRNFLNVPASYWPLLRRAFAEIVARQECLLIAPSKAVQVHYSELVPEFAERFVIVPHGTRAISTGPLRLNFDPGPRLRVVVLGVLAPHKGSALLQEAMPGLLEFADLFLVGCGAEYSAPFEGIAGVTVIPQYRRAELAGILEGIGPHVGLLLSVYPETFSFTLQELFELAIPALCTELGSFADRIEAGVNGFLCAPDAREIVRRLRDLDRDRAPLSRVHARLWNAPRRSARDMLEDYRGLAPLPKFSARAYFAPLVRCQPEDARTRCQVFWRMRETDFAEAQSSTDRFTADKREHSLRLAIPSFEEEPFEFRFDPADRAGAMIVHRLVVKSQRGDILWTLNGDTGGIRKFEMEFLPGPGDGSAGVLHFSSDDPRFILPLDREACRGLRDGGLVEIDCAWFPGDHARLPLAWARALFQARWSQQHHESQAAALRAELDRVRGDWENCRRRIEAMEQPAAEPSETPTPSGSRICPDGPQAGSEAG